MNTDLLKGDLAAYCRIRNQLEEQYQNTVGRLMATSSVIVELVDEGGGPPFENLIPECKRLRADIDNAKRRLEEHCSEHGCCAAGFARKVAVAG